MNPGHDFMTPRRNTFEGFFICFNRSQYFIEKGSLFLQINDQGSLFYSSHITSLHRHIAYYVIKYMYCCFVVAQIACEPCQVKTCFGRMRYVHTQITSYESMRSV